MKRSKIGAWKKYIKINGFDVLDACERMSWNDAVYFAEKARAEEFGGFTDWVLPDSLTLKALAHLDLDECDERFWSSSGDSCGLNKVRCNSWVVDFGCGLVFGNPVESCNHVRLVRASQCLDIGRAGHIESMLQANMIGTESIPDWIARHNRRVSGK